MLFSTTETKMMGRMRLLKLLYLANRKSLKETGDPIVDDDAFAMEGGPVLTHKYDLMKGNERNQTAQAAWSAHFKVVDSIQVQMVSDPGSDHLSDYDVEALIDIARMYQDQDDYDLSRLTHTFEEYIRCWGDGSRRSVPIPTNDLLKGIGYSPEEINVALSEARLYAMEQDLLGCPDLLPYSWVDSSPRITA